LSAISGGGASQVAVDDQARRIAHQSKEKFLKCLADETENALPRKLGVQEFVVFIKGRCLDEVKQFRIALLDYILALDHPDLDIETHFAKSNKIIANTISDIADTYVGLIRASP
jgi:hypothetical protein